MRLLNFASGLFRGMVHLKEPSQLEQRGLERSVTYPVIGRQGYYHLPVSRENLSDYYRVATDKWP